MRSDVNRLYPMNNEIEDNVQQSSLNDGYPATSLRPTMSLKFAMNPIGYHDSEMCNNYEEL